MENMFSGIDLNPEQFIGPLAILFALIGIPLIIVFLLTKNRLPRVMYGAISVGVLFLAGYIWVYVMDWGFYEYFKN